MKKIKLQIELEYDAELIYGSDNTKDLFINDILNGNLNLFSDEIGDEIENIKILKIEKI